MDILKDLVNSQMDTYKIAFEEGRKAGYREGYKKANEEIMQIIERSK